MSDTVLAERSNTGLVIQLHYSNDKLAISIIDGGIHVTTFSVDPENAYDAYTHPFAYAGKLESPQTENESDETTEFEGLELWHSLRSNKSHANDSESDWR